MKKVISPLLLLLLTVIASACNGSSSARRHLAELVETANSEMPRSFGSVGTIESVTYDTDMNQVTLTMDINTDALTIAEIRNAESMNRKTQLSYLSGDESRPVTQAIVEAGASLRTVYKNVASGESCEFVLLGNEIKEAYERGADNAVVDNEMLEQVAATVRQTCPKQMSPDFYMTDCYLTPTSLCYEYELGDGYSIDILEDQKEMAKNQIIEQARSDAAIRQLMNACLQTGRNVKYIYKVENQGSITIVIDPADI